MRFRQHLATAVATISVMTFAAVAQTGEVLWKFDLSNISGAFVTVAADGTIYTVDWDRLWAINPNGTVKWTFEDAGAAGGLSVAGSGQPVALLPDGRIVVAAGHTIWALHTDGTVAWSFSWDGGFKNQIDNGPGIGPDGNIYATTALNDGFGLGVFSLTPDGELRWQDEPDPTMIILNASHNQRVRFTQTRLIFGFVNTSGSQAVYAYDFDGSQTNFIDYTCLSSPRTDEVDRLLLAGVCGLQAIDLETDSILWTVGLGPVNMTPIAGSDGVVYSGNWHGSISAIDPQGQILWTSPEVGLQRTLAVSDEHGMFLYAGENFGEPNWFGAVDITSGQELFSIPFETVSGHNELGWSNEAAFSPDGRIAYFTTRFTSNGTSGRLYAVRIADGEAACPADLDSSGDVGINDFLGLLAAWGLNPGHPADLDGDDVVGITDLLQLLATWGPCP